MSALVLHLAFGLGGGLGALARHGMTLWITHRFPLSTLIVNVAGSFILGLALKGLTSFGGLEGEELRRLAFGFCGGFTTFSSFAYQSFDLHRNYSFIHAATNIAMSLVLCVLAFVLGHVVGMAIVGEAV